MGLFGKKRVDLDKLQGRVMETAGPYMHDATQYAGRNGRSPLYDGFTDWLERDTARIEAEIAQSKAEYESIVRGICQERGIDYQPGMRIDWT